MEIIINGNVTINNTENTETTNNTKTTNNTETTKTTETQASQAQQEERQPIDRTGEVLIPNDTSFNDLLRLLRTKPEAAAAEVIEDEEKEREAREAKLRELYGEDYKLMTEGTGEEETLEKEKRRPGAVQLRLYVPRVAKIEMSAGGLCEVFSNGYAIYDNGDRKTVVWVPDCGSTTYYFGELRDNEKQYMKQKEVVGEDILGPAPWYNAIMLRGEDQIWINMDHPKSIGTASDSDKPEEWETKAYYWSCGAHFDNPEEAYLKKEAAEERRKALTDKQREAYILYYEEGYTMEQIAEILGVDWTTIRERLQAARKIYKANREKYFSE